MSKRENNHSTQAETRERSYERMREAGFSQEVSKKVAEQATRETYEAKNKADKASGRK